MLLGKRDVIGQPLSQFFNGSELEKLIQVLNKVSKSGNPVTPAPMNERASDYAGAPEDNFVHSIVPIHGSDGNKPKRLFIYTGKV